MAKNTPPSMEMSFKLNSNKPISSNVLPPSLPHKRPLERNPDLEIQQLSHNGVITFEENEDELTRTKRKKCNCKNSKCLKLYCECFANQQLCDGCNCTGCCNTSEHLDTVRKARSSTLDRNPKAFRNKIAYSPSPKAGPGRGEPLAGVHSRGCHCKKSNCLKKYCECFQANILCGDNCKCRECKNFEGSNDRRVVLQSLGRSSPSPPAKKMRPTSVPPTTMMAHPGMGISKPTPSRPSPSIGAFSPRFDPKTQPRLSELLTAAEEEEKRNFSIDIRTNILNDSAEGLVSFRKPETIRSVSAPIHHSQQDPSALQELAGMMSKTVALNRGALSLAPPRISPTPYNYDLFPSNSVPMSVSPQSAVRPSFVSSPPPNITSIRPSANIINVNEPGPPQGPGIIVPTVTRPGPMIGGGAFKRVNSNPNASEGPGRFS